jgi:hypothetical protein
MFFRTYWRARMLSLYLTTGWDFRLQIPDLGRLDSRSQSINSKRLKQYPEDFEATPQLESYMQASDSNKRRFRKESGQWKCFRFRKMLWGGRLHLESGNHLYDGWRRRRCSWSDWILNFYPSWSVGVWDPKTKTRSGVWSPPLKPPVSEIAYKTFHTWIIKRKCIWIVRKRP